MNEKQRRALELLLSKDLAIGGGFGDKVPKHGGPYRGPREVSPLMKVGLYGMQDPNAGLRSYPRSHITIQNVPPPKLKQARIRGSGASANKFGIKPTNLELSADAAGSFRRSPSTSGYYFPQYGNAPPYEPPQIGPPSIRVEKPGLINYYLGGGEYRDGVYVGTPTSTRQPGRFANNQTWENVMSHELRHAGLRYLKDNPSLIPDFSYVSRGPTDPRGPKRESAAGLISTPEGRHRLIGAMSTAPDDRIYEGQPYKYPAAEKIADELGKELRIATTTDEREARQKIMQEINKKVAATKESLVKKKPKKKKKYTKPR